MTYISLHGAGHRFGRRYFACDRGLNLTMSLQPGPKWLQPGLNGYLFWRYQHFAGITRLKLHEGESHFRKGKDVGMIRSIGNCMARSMAL